MGSRFGRRTAKRKLQKLGNWVIVVLSCTAKKEAKVNPISGAIQEIVQSNIYIHTHTRSVSMIFPPCMVNGMAVF